MGGPAVFESVSDFFLIVGRKTNMTCAKSQQGFRMEMATRNGAPAHLTYYYVYRLE